MYFQYPQVESLLLLILFSPRMLWGPMRTLFKQRRCAWVILGVLDSEFLVNLLHLLDCCTCQRGQCTFISKE